MWELIWHRMLVSDCANNCALCQQSAELSECLGFGCRLQGRALLNKNLSPLSDPFLHPIQYTSTNKSHQHNIQKTTINPNNGLPNLSAKCNHVSLKAQLVWQWIWDIKSMNPKMPRHSFAHVLDLFPVWKNYDRITILWCKFTFILVCGSWSDTGCWCQLVPITVLSVSSQNSLSASVLAADCRAGHC